MTVHVTGFAVSEDAGSVVVLARPEGCEVLSGHPHISAVLPRGTPPKASLDLLKQGGHRVLPAALRCVGTVACVERGK